MKELKYIQRIRSEESLLSMPQSLSKILSMIKADEFSMDALGKVIMTDPGLTSKILKMANSAFYQRRARIGGVKQAIMILGVMQVKCLALSASVFQTNLLEKQYGINIKEMFSHFISVALGSRMLAEKAGFGGAEEAFIAGLLHDIGLVFFLHHYPEDYRGVIDQADRFPTLARAEREILGIDHATVGEMLAQKWNFPDSLIQAIGHHHEVPETVDHHETVHFVQLSALINKPLIHSRLQNMEHRLNAINHLAAQLHIDRQQIDEVSHSLLIETMAAAEYLGIDIGDPIEVLQRANSELSDSYLTIENLFRERQELSRRILAEERRAAMMETKTVAIATLSHYINNAAMAISGRAQLIKMLLGNGVLTDEGKRLDPIVDVMEKSVK
jgi:putative nucleotidyltransferase with HDIG domain